MKNKTRLLGGLVAGVAALAFASCAYDPYYDGGGYSSASYGGYGDGYGYGGSGFSTSIFVSTGNPRWGYDPYCGAYYDYTRRAYYDPYLYGYYPVGYRPRYIYGAPHPHGWRRGHSRIAPPSRVRSTTLRNYSHREQAYRGLNRSWSGQVRSQPPTRSGGFDRDRRTADPRARQFQRSGSSGRDYGRGGDATRGGFRGGQPQVAPPTQRERVRGNQFTAAPPQRFTRPPQADRSGGAGRFGRPSQAPVPPQFRERSQPRPQVQPQPREERSRGGGGRRPERESGRGSERGGRRVIGLGEG